MIPKTFHFIFGLEPQVEPFHIIHYLCLKSCLCVNRPERINFYYHYEPFGEWWERIRPALHPVKVSLESFVKQYEYEDPYIRQFDYAHQSDFIRLKILIEQGGVYADMDTLFVNPLPDALFQAPFVIGEEDPIICEKTKVKTESLCNAFLMAEKASVFAKRWYEDMYQVFDGTWSRHSGTQAQILSREMPGAVHIEPKTSFYKHMWSREGIHTLLQGLDTNLEGVYSFHLWAHLWWSPFRIDFTDFHAGLVTEKFIRTTDTTYNVIVRRYLN